MVPVEVQLVKLVPVEVQEVNKDHREVVIIFPDGQQVKGTALGLNETCDCGMVKITEPAGNATPASVIPTGKTATPVPPAPEPGTE